ncbi:hypothetical protein KKC44_06705 [Patescibacteria group bacterium]|nr:hypothetical protein [Patescibacteria group bacterium]
MNMKKYFGTDGIRGHIKDEVMSFEFGEKIGRAIVKYCRSCSLKPKIVIARDTRITGKKLEKAVTDSLLGGGGEVISAEILPTPGLAFLTRELKCSLGLMISASHNPADYNGYKFFTAKGEKFSER